MPRKRKQEPTVQQLPLLPLKDVVLFPRMVSPLFVGRPESLAAVETAVRAGSPIFLCTQRDAHVESPGQADLYEVGIAGNILQTLAMPDGSMKVVVEGMARGRIHSLRRRADYVQVTVSRIEDEAVSTDDETLALMRTVLGQFEEYARVSQRLAPEVVASVQSVLNPGDMGDLICAYLPGNAQERQSLLDTIDVNERLQSVASILMRENHLLRIEQQVRARVQEQMERSQREYYLNEQLKAIHHELGNREDAGDEYADLRKQLDEARMPDEVREKAMREFARYERMPAMSPEASVIRSYLEWIVEMPWQKRTRDTLHIDQARVVLDQDHYGLAKVKERILEFLAVRKLSRSRKGPVLCFVGPPGVGKTSLGRSIARAMKRQFVRVSLGGVRDEAEIRGHRRTYIGALPGRVIQSIRKCGVMNPVFMLDEIDKMSMDFRGDPSAALLEVLDPEQNRSFSDHYLEVDFDLSEIFFITTANTEYDIPAPLHDRMEVVRLSGYTAFEKEHIARLFLIPKQRKECGLNERRLRFTPGGIGVVIQRYTREAGVRELERRIASVCRKVARRVLANPRSRGIVVDATRAVELLGPQEYPDLRVDAQPQVGVAVGVAWTMAGGDVLHIETSLTKGKGSLMLTGQLGEVMKESAQAAYTYLRAHAQELGIGIEFWKATDIHIHVPEGAIPKDGPSAGTVIAVSMLSALRNVPPKAASAMTGEITLRGRVLPVGGVKEKALAAHRSGIRCLVMPEENKKDLAEIPAEVKRELQFVFVQTVDDAFKAAFEPIAQSARKARRAPVEAKAKAKAETRQARPPKKRSSKKATARR